MSYAEARAPRGLDEIHVDSVDGVPLLWIDAQIPFSISLHFRVGRVDEGLTNSGITHLLEHLAFPHGHRDDVGNNGTTGLTETVFYSWGDPPDAAQFIQAVSRGISKPATDRIETERGIVLTEEANQGGGLLAELLLERFGAVGAGIVGFRQLGLPNLAPSDIRQWSSRYFNTGNAIMCMTGPPPGRLALELPAGERSPAPLGEAAPGPFPRWTTTAQPFVGLSVVTDHGPAAGMAARIVERRLFQRLRTDLAISYSVASSAELIDSGTLHRALIADCLAESAALVAATVIEIADRIATDGPTSDELRKDIEHMERQLRHEPRAIAGWMAHAAQCYLHRIDVPEFSEFMDARRSLTWADVRDAWVAALGSAVLLVPPWADVPDRRFAQRTWPPPLEGRTFHPPGVGRLRGGRRATLSGDGVTLTDPELGSATVHFKDCVALLRAPAGRRALVDRCGRPLPIDGGSYGSGDQLIRAIDDAVPSHLWIDFPDG